MEELAELGVILVMFGVGLEFRIKKLVSVLPRAGVAVLVECGTLLSAGYGLGQLLGWTTAASIALGIPAAVFLGWLGSPYPGAGLGVVLVIALGLVWRRAGQVQREVRSGAEQVVEMLARQTAEGPPAEPGPAVIPGLDDIVRVSLQTGSFAVGKTLAEVNLRALTGATVVAIHHVESGSAIVPSGRERLSQGDTLALMGPLEAKERARDLLLSGPSPMAPAGPGGAGPYCALTVWRSASRGVRMTRIGPHGVATDPGEASHQPRRLSDVQLAKGRS